MIFFPCIAPRAVKYFESRRLKIVRVLEFAAFFVSVLVVCVTNHRIVFDLRDQAIGNFVGNEYYASLLILLFLFITEFLPTFAFAYHLDLFSNFY